MNAYKTGPKKMTVHWVTPTGNTILHSMDVILSADGRLPVKQVCDKWNCKDLVWQDIEEKIVDDGKGYSTISFGMFDSLKVTATHK